MKIATVNFIFIKPDKKILLQKRDYAEGIKEPGKWCFPGGHIEEGESIALAALREIKEETGVDLPEDNLEFLCDIDNFGNNGKSRVFTCNVDDNIKIVCNEGEKMEWKTLDEIKELANLEFAETHKALVPILKKFLNKK